MLSLLKRHTGALQLLFVVGVVGTALLLSLSLRPEQNGAPPARTAAGLKVSVVAPAAIAYRPKLSLSGTVAARTVTNIVPEVPGRIVEVSDAFRPGGYLNAGEVVFRIEPADYELAVERTLAEIEAARSELTLLEAEAEAEINVWNGQFPDREIPDLIARIPQIAAAKARIRSGEAARRAAELDLERTVVRSPFPARVLTTELDIGQVVTGQAAVGTLFSIDSLEVEVPISSSELALLGNPVDRPATIALPGGRSLAGVVTRIAAALDERTRLGTLFIEPDAAAGLTAGEFVEVDIAAATSGDALGVPASALTSRDRLWVVEAGRLAGRQVTVLGGDRDRTFVLPFDFADGVVAVPPANGRAGMPVTPAETGGMAAVPGTDTPGGAGVDAP